MNSDLVRNRLTSPGGLLVSFWALCTLVSALCWIWADGAQFAVIGTLGSAIVSVPLLRRSHRLVSAWSLVTLVVYISCGLRGIGIATGWAPNEETLHRVLLRYQPTSYFLWPSLLHVLFLALLTAAYLLVSRRTLPLPPRPAPGNTLPRLRVAVLAAVGFLALLLYIHTRGGFSLSNLSTKSAVTTNGQVNAGAGGTGLVSLVCSLSAIVFWIVTAHVVRKRRGRRIRPRQLAVIAGLGVLAVLQPIFSSSRSDAVITLLVAAGIVHFLDPDRFRLGRVALLGSGVLAIIAVMTIARAAAHNIAMTGGPIKVVTDGLLNALVYNRNFGDPLVTSHIVHHVPGSLPYQYGDTMLVWLVAGIPRFVWPGKPLISSGPLVGHYVFGQPHSGVPPGVVGDWYLNFGVAGVLLGALVVGAVLAYVDLWGSGRRTPRMAVLYVPFAVAAAKTMMSQGLGAGLFQGLTQLVLTLLCFAFLYPPGWLTRRLGARSAPQETPAPASSTTPGG